jgi:hypothetical protein
MFSLDLVTIKNIFYEKIIDNDDHRLQSDDPIATHRTGEEHEHETR